MKKEKKNVTAHVVKKLEEILNEYFKTNKEVVEGVVFSNEGAKGRTPIMDVSANETGDIFLYKNTENPNYLDISAPEAGVEIKAPKSMENYFCGILRNKNQKKYYNIAYLDVSHLDVSKTTNFSYCFREYGKSKDSKIVGLNHWKFNLEVSLKGMFLDAFSNNETVFLDLSEWKFNPYPFTDFRHCFQWFAKNAQSVELILNSENWGNPSSFMYEFMFYFFAFNATQVTLKGVEHWSNWAINNSKTMFAYFAPKSNSKLDKTKSGKAYFNLENVWKSEIHKIRNKNSARVADLEEINKIVPYFKKDIRGINYTNCGARGRDPIADVTSQEIDVYLRQKRPRVFMYWKDKEKGYVDIATKEPGYEVTANMSMRSCFCEENIPFNLEYLDVTNLDVSNVDNFGLCFWNFGAKNNIQLIGCENWDTSKAISIEGIFLNSFSHSRNKRVNLDLSKWNFENVKCARNAFKGFGKSAETVEVQLPTWILKENVMCDGIFQGLGEKSKRIAVNGIENWQVNTTTTLDRAFYKFGPKAEYRLDISNWWNETTKPKRLYSFVKSTFFKIKMPSC